jgi:hypothetical protein
MSPIQGPVDSGTLLEGFFGEGNGIALSAFEAGGHWVGKRFLLERLARSSTTILPRKNPADPQCLELYALAFSRPDFHTLREELMAYLGPSYSDFTGRPANLRVEDAIDALVDRCTAGMWFRLRVSPSRLANVAGADRDRWPTNLLLQQWEASGRVRRTDPRGVPWILRDFRFALQARDGAQAESGLADLRRGNLLDAVNILFLEVEMWDSLDRYDALLKHESLNDLLHLDRPTAVTACLLTALYRTYLWPFEECEDALGALERMRLSVLPTYRALFDVTTSVHRADVALIQILAALARGASLEDFDRVVDLGSIPEQRRPYNAKLRALCAGSDVPTFAPALSGVAPILDAPGRLSQGDYEGAFLLAADLPPSVERTWILCQCAEALSDLSVDTLAWDALRDLPAEAREALSNRPAVHKLAQRFGVSLSPPENWIQWFSLLTESVAAAQYLSFARRGQDAWPTTDVLDHPNRTQELQSLIASGPASGCAPAFYAAVPMVVAWMRRHHEYPQSVPAALQLVIARAIVASTQGRSSDLEVLHDLIDSTLESLADEQDYPIAADLAASAIADFGAPDRLDWVLDLADTFIRKTPPRLGMAGAVRVLDEASTRVVACIRNSTPTHWQLLEALHRESSHLEAFERIRPMVPSAENRLDDPLSTLSNVSVAIYTLDQSQAARAKQLLVSRVPNIRVTLLHDYANSVRLSQYARTSDVFVVITRCATHAATGAIQAARGSKPTLTPKGRGAASILRELESHFAVS